jgi:hypothetical protein
VDNTFKFNFVEFEPVRYAALFNRFDGHPDGLERATSFADLNDIAALDNIRGNINLSIIDHEMPVSNKLARLGTGTSKTQAIYDGIESLLEQQ